MVSIHDKVQRVVALMLENRSFDHMLGFMEHPGLKRLDGKVLLLSGTSRGSGDATLRLLSAAGHERP